jgi:hypothetical protein
MRRLLYLPLLLSALLLAISHKGDTLAIPNRGAQQYICYHSAEVCCESNVGNCATGSQFLRKNELWTIKYIDFHTDFNKNVEGHGVCCESMFGSISCYPKFNVAVVTETLQSGKVNAKWVKTVIDQRSSLTCSSCSDDIRRDYVSEHLCNNTCLIQLNDK